MIFSLPVSFLVILVHPLPVNTTVNSVQVNFTCEARAELLDFFVNETAFNANFASKGFHQVDPDPINSTTIRRVLLVDPREGSNNTNISCVGFSRSPLSEDTSNTVLLLIQGVYHVLYL